MNRRGAGSNEIRAELDRTRASLDRAFDALGTKLTPSQLLWDGVGVFRSGAGTALSRAMELAREHPLPASVIGVGVGWLLIENARGGRGRGLYEGAPAGPWRGGYDTGGYGRESAGGYGREPAGRYGRYSGGPAEAEEFVGGEATAGARYSDAPPPGAGLREGASGAVDRVEQAASRAGERVSEAASRAGERVSEAAGTVTETAGRAVETVKERGARVAGTVREQAAQAAGTVKEAAGTVKEQAAQAATAVKTQAARVGGEVRQTARRAGSELDRMLREDPLTVGLGALAFGVLVGLVLPTTRREDEVLGEVRDRKLEEAREAAREVLDKGRQVAAAAARSAKETLREEAQRRNLAPQIVEKVVGGGGGQAPAPGGQAPAPPPGTPPPGGGAA